MSRSETGSDGPVLTKKEKDELEGIDQKIGELNSNRVTRLREMTRAKGFSAEKLEDLKSNCGEPFVENAKSVFNDYKSAMARPKKENEAIEHAYLCAPMYLPEGDGCGWVKGVPIEEEFDHTGPMVGSAGTKYKCTICDLKIGEHITKMA